MGIMRALTIKRASILSTRAPSILKGRPQISLPTELISSTNKLTYTSPSVEAMQKAIAEQSLAALTESNETSSEAESNTEHIESQTPNSPTSATTSRRSSNVSNGSEPSLTDASSVSSSPYPNSPDPQNLFADRTSYFAVDALVKPAPTSVTIEDAVDPLTVIVPAVPRRAASHSKHEHERLARRRSQRVSELQHGTSALHSRSSIELADADDVFAPMPLAVAMPELMEVEEEVSPVVQEETAHIPQENQQVGQELQLLIDAVDELSTFAEDEDAQLMRELGLKKWSVGGYLDVVGDAWGSDPYALDDVATAVAA